MIVFLGEMIVIWFFAIGFLFKIMHWPGAGPLFYFDNLLLLFALLPYGIAYLIRYQKADAGRTHGVVLLIYFFSQSTGTLVNSGSGKINIDAVLQQGINTEMALKSATSRNLQLYATLDKAAADNTGGLTGKVKKLKALTDSAEDYVKQLRALLIMKADGVAKNTADTLSSLYIESKVNMEVSTTVLIGDVYAVKKDKYSGFMLRKVIEDFLDSLLGLLQEQNRAIIREGLNLNTNKYADENGEFISWEIANFNHMPLLYVCNTLTNIRYEIKNAEYQALTDIVNAENSGLHTALFKQISDLNSKYDAFKKQEEISKLKAENAKGMDLLNAKDSELDSTKRTIIFFSLAVLVFIVLIFFIIRTNYLRRIANRLLKEQNLVIERQKSEVESQKALVEEKQKEIIESITYAKRLQEAILPPEEFITGLFPDHFILYKPKDIVAGDFYWSEKINDLLFLAAADSTGHGVPGAMVSVVCSNALNRSVKEFHLSETGQILNKTRELVLETFEKSTSEVKDGMDISLLCIDRSR
ncbi:MAG TPA: hypothetical protein VII99_13385, partial [Bacteroidia bacterium]